MLPSGRFGPSLRRIAVPRRAQTWFGIDTMAATLVRPGSKRAPLVAALVTLAIGVLVCAGCVAWLRAFNARVAKERFSASVERVTGQIEDRLSRYEYGARGARGAVVAAGESIISREAFRRYMRTRDIAREFPGARGFGFMRRVRFEDEAAFLRAARLDGAPDFAIRQEVPHTGERYVIQYVEPMRGNRDAVGVDAAAEDMRRAAALRAMETGRAVLTAPVTLAQAVGMRQRGFLLFLPVQLPDRPVATPAERRAATVGWAFAPLVIDEVLADLPLKDNGLEFSLTDREPESVVRFFETQGAEAPGADGLAKVRSLKIYDRVWDLDARAQPGFVAGLNLVSPAAIGLLILALSALSASVVHLRLSGRRREMRAVLEKSRLAAIVENANDAILGKTLDGTITDWNPAAERLFGFSAAEAVGRRAGDLLIPPHLRFEESETLDRIRRGGEGPVLSTLRMRRDGSLFPVLASTSPIRSADGTVSGVATMVRDISAQVAAEERAQALQASLERQVAERTAELKAVNVLQSAILSNAGYAVIATDGAGTITLFNPAAERLLGYAAAELIGRETPALFHDAREVVERTARISAEFGERIEPGFEAFVARTRRGLPNRDEWTLLTKAGERVPVLLDINALRAEDGTALGFIGIVLDLRERYQHESEMRAANAGSWNYDLASNRVRLSAECARQHGLPDAPCDIDLTTGWRPLCHPDDVEKVLAELGGVLATGGAYMTEFRIVLPEGGLRWLTSIGRVETDASGRPARVIGLTLDVTARKEAERALRESEQRYRMLAENTVEMIVQTDMEAVRRYVSPASRRILGYEPEELVGRRPHEMVHPDDLPEVAAILADLCEGRRTEAVKRQRYRRKDGGYVWVEVNYRLFHDADGHPLGCMACTRDISEQQAHSEALQEAKLAAERASQAKTDFLAAMSHEIRTPLNAVIGFTDLMIASDRLEPDLRRQADLVRSSGQALLIIVNDILDFSKVEAGAIELARESFAPAALVDGCVSIVGGLARQKGLEIQASIDGDLPERLVGDQDRLRQILLNLLNNAVKFTRRGSISLALRHEGAAAGGERLRFSVTDTGIGIPQDKLPRLFQRFSQVDGSIQRDFGGTGLGLAISKHLVELMGGEIGVSSQEGAGSTFWFRVTLPRGGLLETLAAVAPPMQAPVRARLLLVEDSEINQTLARAVLEAAGHSVDIVGDGAAAVRAVEEGSYDLVLMDIQMPGMDGITATRAIRRLTTASARVPIVAMTANVLPDEVSGFAAAGMDGHVGKPFNRTELIETIAAQLGWSPKPGQPEAQPDEPEAGVDRETFDTLLGLLGPAKVSGILRLLVEELKGALAGPAGTPEQRDAIRRDAHALSSAAGAVGFLGLSLASRRLDGFKEARVAERGDEAFLASLEEARALARAARLAAERLMTELAPQGPDEAEPARLLGGRGA